jgi:Signal transduction histidine kinase
LAKDLGSIRTDRTKLKQSLLNILSNGSKFTENGRLTVVAERFESDRPMVRFAVSDTGIGMTESSSAACSRRSARPRLRPPKSTAAPASAWRFPGGSANCSAATSR